MSEFVTGALAVFIVWLVVRFYRYFMGCGGGHVWPDEPSEYRMELIPFANEGSHDVHIKETYKCEHVNCRGSKTSVKSIGGVDFEDAKDAIEEVTNDE
jgi:hypothetical protein